ncbi:MAG: hypothetical protein ACE5D0_09770 [Fidelibacterota bacterium]
MNSILQKILIIVFSMLMLINTNCDPTNYAEPDLHDYPTYFDELEHDILYRQGNNLVLIDKETQTRKVIAIPGYKDNFENIRWAANGESIFFLDTVAAFSTYKGKLYNYNIESEDLSHINEIECQNYRLSPAGKFIIYYSFIGALLYDLDEYHLYDMTNNQTIDIEEQLIEILNNDSTNLNTIDAHRTKWLSDNIFSVGIYLEKIFPDTSKIFYYVANIEIDVNGINLKSLDNYFYSNLTYNQDSTFAFYKQSRSSEHDPGTFVIDLLNSDTIQILDEYSPYMFFTKDSRYIIYGERLFMVLLLFENIRYRVYDTLTGESWGIFDEAEDVENISISQSGSQILCRADFHGDDYQYNIWVMNFDGSGHTILSDPNYSNRYPQFRLGE